MSKLKFISEERNKVSPRITENIYSSVGSNKFPPTLSKRKVLQPLLSTSDMTPSANFGISGRNDRRNITGRVLSAKEHRLRQLQDQLTDAQYHLNELYRENRLLKSIQKRQDSALQRYESANGEIPKLINSHNEELRSMQTRYKQIKLQFREVSQRMKEKDSDLFKLGEEYKRLLELSKDASLADRETLRNQVKELTGRVQKQNETISSLQRRLMLEEKGHKRQMHLEMARHKETQLQLANALSHSNELTSVIEMKEKLIAGSNVQRKLFPRINSVHSNIVKPSEPKYKQNSVPNYSSKDNISSDVSLDSNIKCSSSSSFSVIGKSLQQFNIDSNQNSENNDVPISTQENMTNKRENTLIDNVYYKSNTELDLAEAIHVGMPNMNISESDTDPPRSSDEDVRERVENLKRQIRKSHRNEADASFEDVKSMMELENKRVSRGTLSITSDDSSNSQFTMKQIDKVLSRSISKQSDSKNNDNSKSLLVNLENTDFNSIFNIGKESEREVSNNENSSEQSSRKISDASLLTDYMTRRNSNDYDSDNKSIDTRILKKSPEMNNNQVGSKDGKSELDSDKKKKLLAALKAIDRGEDQGLAFNTSKRSSVSSRKN